MRSKLFILALLPLLLGPSMLMAAQAAKPQPKPIGTPGPGGRPPEKLSDLYRFFTYAVRDGLHAEVQGWPVRILGRSWELMRDAKFPEVELTLKPFETQGLKFEKAELLFRRLEIDRDALLNWKLEFKEVKEVQSRLVFTLRSLGQRLARESGKEIKLQADMEEQVIVLSGPGHYLGVPCQVEARCQPLWDEATKTLRLKAQEQRFGGRKVPGWLWWLGASPVPQGAVLDFGFSWIPFNIQEVHVGWDHVNLSTNW